MSEQIRKDEFRKLLARQAKLIKPARDWLLSTKLNFPFSSVLEVGCGCGDVLHELGEDKWSVGLDIELELLKELKAEGVLGDGHFLPFQNGSFDLVYCHFSIMWFSDPAAVIREMARVAKKSICCMAEYDYGARLDFPDEFGYIRDKLAEGIISDGGDPYAGRKLNQYFKEANLEADVGAYCHVMDSQQLLAGFEDEWSFIQEFTDMDPGKMDDLKKSEFESISSGTRFLFTPVFYAIARK
ncbi:MAG: class I SAM-dependent methyltransferase [Thermoplasmata archaeon]|nr:MAG: class I SAM-dependent methyltransferase [Thermoplasmata archaeon]